MDSRLRGNDVTCVSGSLRKYFAKVSACLKTLSDRHFIDGCHQQISKNKPVVSNTSWERGRLARKQAARLHQVSEAQAVLKLPTIVFVLRTTARAPGKPV